MSAPQRQPHRKRRSFAGIAAHADLPMVKLDQLFHQSQPDAGALEGPGAGIIHLVKTVEDMPDPLRRNADATVAYGDYYFPA